MLTRSANLARPQLLIRRLTVSFIAPRDHSGERRGAPLVSYPPSPNACKDGRVAGISGPAATSRENEP